MTETETHLIEGLRKQNPHAQRQMLDLYSMIGISALILIDRDGTIIAVPNSVEELKAKLEEIFPDNK